MAPRKTWTTLPGAKPAPNPSKNKKRGREDRVLDAYNIAEKEYSSKLKIAKHRLGDLDMVSDSEAENENYRGPKRAKNRRESNAGADSDDSEQFQIGVVNSEDDSEIDSDEAFGESDDEFYTQMRKKRAAKGGGALQEEDSSDDSDQDLGDDGADLGEDAVDLATMLDQPMSSDMEDEESDSGESESDEYSSDDSDDAEDKQMDADRLAELHDIINSLRPTEKKSEKRTQAVTSHELGPMSELGIPALNKLQLDEVLSSVTDKRMRRALKSLVRNQTAAGKGGVPGKIEAPLPRRQQDQLDRIAATKETNNTLARWVDTVKHHRRAEHLSFPLVDPSAATSQGAATFLPSTATKPITELESKVTGILADSGIVSTDPAAEDKALKGFDELEEKQMTVEEVAAARAALRKQRDLLFREELKAKRIKKIKSKAYRRVHRKQREREAEIEREALIAAGVDMTEEDREKQERRRAEERMGAKHRDSKWAKQAKKSGRTVWDEEAKSGITDMAARNEELRRRIAGKTVHSDESDLGSEFEDDKLGFDSSDEEEEFQGAVTHKLDRADELYEDAATGSKSKLHQLKFMQKAEASLKAQNEAERVELERMAREDAGVVDESADEGAGVNGGRMAFGPKKETTTRPKKASKRREFEEHDSEEDEQEQDVEIITGDQQETVSGRSSRGKTAPRQQAAESTQPTPEGANPWMSAPKPSKKKKEATAGEEVLLVTNRPLIEEAQANQPLPSTASKPTMKPAEGPSPPSAKPAAKADSSKKSKGSLTTTAVALEAPSSDSDSSSESESEAAPKKGRQANASAQIESALARNQALVQQAFGADDVEAEFAREKAAIEEEEDEKEVDDKMVGWGSWTGAGVSKKAPKKNARQQQATGKGAAGKGRPGAGKGSIADRNMTRLSSSKLSSAKFAAGVKPANRKDAKLKNVIINEKVARKSNAYQADSLPFPFTSREEYERSVRMPLGTEWTGLAGTKHRPRVTVKPGTVIKPLDRPVV